MPTTLEEIESFVEYARRTAVGHADGPSLEECLRRWREEQELEETVADINAAVKEIEGGNYMSLEEADRQIRQDLGWPPPSQ